MKGYELLYAIGNIDADYVNSAASKMSFEERNKYFFKPNKKFIALAVTTILILLCSFIVYQAGLFDPWLQTPSVSPVETVRSAIENQIEKEYTLNVQIREITIDEAATDRAIKMYQGSDLAKENGWSDDYLKDNLIVVRAEYYVEYDHEKTFLPDGEIEQYFILLKNEETQKWEIFDNTTNNDPFE